MNVVFGVIDIPDLPLFSLDYSFLSFPTFSTLAVYFNNSCPFSVTTTGCETFFVCACGGI